MPALTLAQLDPDARGIPYLKWKAQELNQLFKELGQMQQPARITPATLEHSMTKEEERQMRTKP